MFERYTEEARRVIFFARTEALGRESPVIATNDLLLGLTHRLYPAGRPFETLHARRDELRTHLGVAALEKVPEPKDIPLSRESKMALAYTAQEADSDHGFSIEPHHILRGILRVGDGTAVALTNFGWDIETARDASRKSRRIFPPKRPPLRRILRYYWRRVIFAVILLGIVAVIVYLRSQNQ